LSESADNKARDKIAAPELQGITSLPVVSREKVLAIRKQLAEGTYDLDERLDFALDGLLTDLTAQDITVTRSC
jgi:anti-sigma28 factor (negative regulator of flagellin synthesis)